MRAFIIGILVIGVAAAAAFFGWQYYQKVQPEPITALSVIGTQSEEIYLTESKEWLQRLLSDTASPLTLFHPSLVVDESLLAAAASEAWPDGTKFIVLVQDPTNAQLSLIAELPKQNAKVRQAFAKAQSQVNLIWFGAFNPSIAAESDSVGAALQNLANTLHVEDGIGLIARPKLITQALTKIGEGPSFEDGATTLASIEWLACDLRWNPREIALVGIGSLNAALPQSKGATRDVWSLAPVPITTLCAAGSQPAATLLWSELGKGERTGPFVVVDALEANTKGRTIGEYKGYELLEFSNDSDSSRSISTYLNAETTFYGVAMGDHFVYHSDGQAVMKYLEAITTDERFIFTNLYSQIQNQITEGSNAYLHISRPTEEEALAGKVVKNGAKNAYFLQWAQDIEHSVYFSTTLLHINLESSKSNLIWGKMLGQDLLSTQLYYPTAGAQPLVVVCDARGIACFDLQGEALWTYAVSERIQSMPEEIDAFGNGKRQLLFATAKAVHLIDRNGKKVEQFPYTASDTIHGLGFIRYESRSAGRILFESNGVLLNLTPEGRETKGWKNPALSSLREGVRHALIKGKDYIIAIDGANSVHFFDRTGKARLSEIKIKPAAYSQIGFELGRTIEQSAIVYLDSSGFIHEERIDGKNPKVVMCDTVPILRFEAVGSSANRKYVVFTEQAIKVLDQSMKVLYQQSMGGAFNVDFPITHSISQSKLVQSGNRLYALDLKGPSSTAIVSSAEAYPLLIESEKNRYKLLLTSKDGNARMVEIELKD